MLTTIFFNNIWNYKEQNNILLYLKVAYAVAQIFNV
jgi:hypothetical protein